MLYVVRNARFARFLNTWKLTDFLKNQSTMNKSIPENSSPNAKKIQIWKKDYDVVRNTGFFTL